MSLPFFALTLAQFHTETNFKSVLCKRELKWGKGVLDFGTWTQKYLRNKLSFINKKHWISVLWLRVGQREHGACAGMN